MPNCVRSTAATSGSSNALRLDLNELRIRTAAQRDFVGIHMLAEVAEKLGAIRIEVKEGLVVVAGQRHGDAINRHDLDHAAAGGDGGQGVPLGRVAERQLVGVGMLCAEVGDPGLDADARLADPAGRLRQPFIGRVPPQQAAQQPHVGPLAFVRGRERAVGVELDENLIDLAVHQVACHPPDAERGRAMRAGRPAHHRPDDVVEDAGIVHQLGIGCPCIG